MAEVSHFRACGVRGWSVRGCYGEMRQTVAAASVSGEGVSATLGRAAGATDEFLSFFGMN